MTLTLQRVFRALLLALLGVATGACALEGAPESRPPNLLLIIADDVGRERIGIYQEATNPGRTPNIDRLGRTGLVFENFWAMPSRSPTRAALLTGRYPHRTGIGAVVIPDPPPQAAERGLAVDVETLPRALEPAGYSSAILGKWHLATRGQGYDHPLQMGFAHHRGSFGNLGHVTGRPGYYKWTKAVDGVLHRWDVYATTDSVNDAIEMAGTLPEPWLLIVSFNAAHAPVHVPPAELHSYTELSDARKQKPMAFRAMVEAMDTEIGRLLGAVAPQQPFVLFLGDNGTDDTAFAKPERKKGRVKGSLYEGGVRVPFIVNHSSIVAPGRRVDGLASVTDLFATLVELAGVDRPAGGLPPDSVSLAPWFRSESAASPRGWLLAERFKPNGPGPYRRQSRAVRDRRFKLIRFGGGQDLFFDLLVDPGEGSPLPLAELEGEAAQAYRRLVTLVEEAPPVRGEAVSPASAAE